MKTLNKYINESLLDDEEELVNSDSGLRNEIRNWILNNYELDNADSLEITADFQVNIRGDIDFDSNSKELTNGMFEFNKVEDGDFGCSFSNINTLKGSPRTIIGGNFTCAHCNNLKNLKGGPERIESKQGINSGNFYCDSCDNLTSLEGAPKYIDGKFHCRFCKNLKNYSQIKSSWKLIK